MSGHSKWATIKRAKGKTDAERGKLFTKLGREIAVAVKAGGSDPTANSALRAIISKCKASNMPNDNISRSIKKASGELGSINYETIIYEGYGPNGMAVIVETLTDNKNRTAGEVRHIFDRANGAMGTSGCVSYLFESKGVIFVEKDAKIDADALMMTSLDAGATDLIEEEDYFEITTTPADLAAVSETLEKEGYKVLRSEQERVPAMYVDLDEDTLVKVGKMLDSFDDNEDVQQVYHNANLPEEEDEE
jgi:YebC/PmpR family DNA-binding regulatory protein